MNKTRRAALADLQNKIDELKADVETYRDEETEYYENMPEGLQDGDRGSDSQTAIDNLEDVISNLEDALSSIEAAQE
jgi:molecular chaperone GrpE (heat shock protein)